MSDAKYYLPYSRPTGDAEQYAGRALELLRKIERLDARLARLMLEPSNVLALAGLRSYSPYNDEVPPGTDMRQWTELLAAHGFLWLNESPHMENPPLASYALVNIEVADRLAETYPLEAVRMAGRCLERSPWGFVGWQAGLDFSLARAMESGELPKEWLTEWWNPHNVRFGMLLGYPGPAIATFCAAEASQTLWKDMKEIIVSDGLFDGASVAFAIGKTASTSPDVVATVRLWQEVLGGVYKVYPPEETGSLAAPHLTSQVS